MKVINKVRRKVKFKDLGIGDTFLKEDKYYLFMKTMPMILEQTQSLVNAVVLNDKAVTYLNDEDEVIVVECEINIIREGW